MSSGSSIMGASDVTRGASRKGSALSCRKRTYAVLLRTLAAGSERFGLRLTQFSIQSNHAHLIVEVDDRHALSRGMQGLCIRIARALNDHPARPEHTLRSASASQRLTSAPTGDGEQEERLPASPDPRGRGRGRGRGETPA